MKVLFYNHTAEVSGAERMLLLILGRLDRLAFAPTLICPHGPLETMARDLGATVATVNPLAARFTWRPVQLVRYGKSFLKIIGELRRQVTKINPDLIHANSIRSGLVATAATFGMKTRVVWHLHDILPRHPLSTVIRLFALLSNRTRMIAVSTAVSRNFAGRFAGLLNGRVRVILNGIETERFSSNQSAGQLVRHELGLDQAAMVCGIVGQVTRRKGQLELIRAFAKASVPNSMLLIVGAAIFNRDRDYAALVDQEAMSLGIAGSVRMLGSRDDVAAVMESLDLLIVNSTAEPFGLVIVEAMACGTPVLASAVDGIPEIIDHGRNGWLFPARDQQALAEAIVQLSGDAELRGRLAEDGYQRAKHFSADRYMSELEEFYLSNGDARCGTLSTNAAARQPEAAKFA